MKIQSGELSVFQTSKGTAQVLPTPITSHGERVSVANASFGDDTFSLGDDDAEFVLVSTRGCLAPASAGFISLSPNAKRLRSSPSFC